MSVRPVEILAAELDDAIAALSVHAEGLSVWAATPECDVLCSAVAKDVYIGLLKAADAAWKIHELLEKG